MLPQELNVMAERSNIYLVTSKIYYTNLCCFLFLSIPKIGLFEVPSVENRNAVAQSRSRAVAQSRSLVQFWKLIQIKNSTETGMRFSESKLRFRPLRIENAVAQSSPILETDINKK